MNKGIHLILLLFISSSLFSQEENSNLKNDIGINVNAIFNKIILKKINDEIANPFPDQLSVLTYRHFYTPKSALRIGIGFDNFSRNDTTLSTFTGPLIEEDKFRFYAFHLGFQKNIIDAKKVKLTIGWDLIGRREYQERNRDQSFVGGGIFFEEVISKDIYKETNLGFGVPLGIQYFFNNRIYISTEFSLELFQTFSKRKTEYDGNINNDFQENPDILNIKLRPPLAIFLNYRF
ncbi:MAG: hypothetical protein AB8F94_20250 [Saprospiraceae bacterium]